MKVGDLVIRKIKDIPDWKRPSAVSQRERLGHGIILSKRMSGIPAHPCITVLYPQTGTMADIAESLMEVISEV